MISCLVFPASLVGCQSPLGERSSTELRDRVIASAQQTVEASAWSMPEPPASAYTAEQRQQLDELSSPGRLVGRDVDPGVGLDGGAPTFVRLSLSQALVASLQNNLEIEGARVRPRIARATVQEEVAAFDWQAFTEASFGRDNRPIPARSVNGIIIDTDTTMQQNGSLEGGVRRRHRYGGSYAVSTRLRYLDNKNPDIELTPDASWSADVGVRFTQPLLRDFGEQVNGARIELARNAQRRETLALRQQTLETLRDTEIAYWSVVFTRYQLAIEQDLLEETVTTQQKLKDRRDVNVNPVQIAQAARELQSRRIAVLRTQSALRDASDQLKRLMNSPRLPLLKEDIVEPVGLPADPILPSRLKSAVVAGLRQRPELAQSLLLMDDRRVGTRVAENQRLPRVDVTGELRSHGLSDEWGDSYGRIGDEFVEYQVGVLFEQEINGRAAAAAYRRARLNEQAAAIEYRSAAQSVVLEIKQAIREMLLARRVFFVAREGRRAAAENLRAILDREESGERLTPEFLLDLKLRSQESLARAQIEEVRAITSLHIARARYLAATGDLPAFHAIELSDANYEIPKPE